MRLLALIVWTTALLNGASAALAAERANRPNIIWIVADDLGYGELGAYGGHEIPTPSLDALAKGGVRFTDAYVTAPFCAASRAGLLTGRYQTRFGFEFNPIGAVNADPEVGLPVGERTVADYLRQSGYVTALIGKWHQGGTARFHPQRRGFDFFFGFLHEGHYYVPPPWDGHVTWLRRRALPDGEQGRWTSNDGRTIWSTHMGSFEPDYDADNPILHGSQPVDEQRNLTEVFTQRAESFIDGHLDQPFFLYVAFSAVHSPLQGSDQWLAQFKHIEDVQRRIFAAMLAQLDDCVGRIVARVEAAELAEQTLIVFLSDNGGPTRELTSSNAPLRGEKGQLFEGGIRVPLILSWPKRLPAGLTDRRFVSALDLLPTALAAARAPMPSGLDGSDILPHLAPGNETPMRASHYWRVGPRAAYRENRWKIYRPAARAAWQLYDLQHDLGEQDDRAAREPARTAALAAAWSTLDAEMKPALWGGPRRTTTDD